MSRAVAKSQRAPSRKGPPIIWPIERNRSCTTLRPAYRNGMAMANRINADAIALPGQIIQNCELVTGPPFPAAQPGSCRRTTAYDRSGGHGTPAQLRDYFSNSREPGAIVLILLNI